MLEREFRDSQRPFVGPWEVGRWVGRCVRTPSPKASFYVFTVSMGWAERVWSVPLSHTARVFLAYGL